MSLLFTSFLISVSISLFVPVFIHQWILNLLIVTLLFLATYYFTNKPHRVYLVDFACYKPELSCMCTNEMFMEIAERNGIFSQENLEIAKKIITRSGLGPRTYVAKPLLNTPPDLALVEARKETEMAIFGAIDELLEKTGIQEKDIGILVVNCAVFSPTPSLADMVVNRYKLRETILCYNLSGMGCSAGVIGIDLAKQLLQVSTENGTVGTYWGNNPSMLLVSVLFRFGGSSVLLSSHSSDQHRSKNQLIHTLHTHLAADNNS